MVMNAKRNRFLAWYAGGTVFFLVLAVVSDGRTRIISLTWLVLLLAWLLLGLRGFRRLERDGMLE